MTLENDPEYQKLGIVGKFGNGNRRAVRDPHIWNVAFCFSGGLFFDDGNFPLWWPNFWPQWKVRPPGEFAPRHTFGMVSTRSEHTPIHQNRFDATP